MNAFRSGLPTGIIGCQYWISTIAYGPPVFAHKLLGFGDRHVAAPLRDWDALFGRVSRSSCVMFRAANLKTMRVVRLVLDSAAAVVRCPGHSQHLF